MTGIGDKNFAAPIYASMVAAEDGESHNLIWCRRNGDRGGNLEEPRSSKRGFAMLLAATAYQEFRAPWD